MKEFLQEKGQNFYRIKRRETMWGADYKKREQVQSQDKVWRTRWILRPVKSQRPEGAVMKHGLYMQTGLKALRWECSPWALPDWLEIYSSPCSDISQPALSRDLLSRVPSPANFCIVLQNEVSAMMSPYIASPCRLKAMLCHPRSQFSSHSLVVQYHFTLCQPSLRSSWPWSLWIRTTSWCYLSLIFSRLMAIFFSCILTFFITPST